MGAAALIGCACVSGVVAMSLHKKAEREYTYEALWDRLDDPDELLQ